MSCVAVPSPVASGVRNSFAVIARTVWLAFHLWDLDAPAVALAWQFLFGRYVHANISWPAGLALALAVWLIYAGDRILDLRRPGTMPRTSRHAFHKRHHRKFMLTAAGALIALSVVTVFLRPLVVKSGFELAALVGAYLACVHLFPGPPRRWFPKELVVGVLFAVGTCLAPWCRAGEGSALLLPGLFFAALCCVNCVLIEVWEWRESGCSTSAHPHPWTLWIWRALRPVLTGIAGAAAFLYLMGLHSVFAAILLSAVCILLLDRYKRGLSADLRRVLADAALLTPLLFVLAH